MDVKVKRITNRKSYNKVPRINDMEKLKPSQLTLTLEPEGIVKAKGKVKGAINLERKCGTQTKDIKPRKRR